jgi:hypothetical protein
LNGDEAVFREKNDCPLKEDISLATRIDKFFKSSDVTTAVFNINPPSNSRIASSQNPNLESKKTEWQPFLNPSPKQADAAPLPPVAFHCLTVVAALVRLPSPQTSIHHVFHS